MSSLFQPDRRHASSQTGRTKQAAIYVRLKNGTEKISTTTARLSVNQRLAHCGDLMMTPASLQSTKPSTGPSKHTGLKLFRVARIRCSNIISNRLRWEIYPKQMNRTKSCGPQE